MDIFFNWACERWFEWFVAACSIWPQSQSDLLLPAQTHQTACATGHHMQLLLLFTQNSTYMLLSVQLHTLHWKVYNISTSTTAWKQRHIVQEGTASQVLPGQCFLLPTGFFECILCDWPLMFMAVIWTVVFIDWLLWQSNLSPIPIFPSNDVFYTAVVRCHYSMSLHLVILFS